MGWVDRIGLGWVDRVCWRIRSMCPWAVAMDWGGLRETMEPVKPRALDSHPFRVALRKVGRAGLPKARWVEDTKMASLIFRMEERREGGREGGSSFWRDEERDDEKLAPPRLDHGRPAHRIPHLPEEGEGN